MRAHALVLVSTAVALAALAAPAARAAVITQSASIPFTTTNFGPGTGSTPPLSVQQFDTQNGSRVLDSVTLSMNAMVRTDFSMIFTNPATITDSVMSNTPGSPGPAITIFQPDGTHSLLTVQSPSDPGSLTREVTYGFHTGQTTPQGFASTLPSSSPFYLAPAVTQASNTLTLNSPSDLALFTGTGSLSLPVAASANSMFTSSSGNGYGGIFTHGAASVTVTYNYHNQVPAPETVPEPAAVLLWGVGGLALLAARRAIGRR
jgi:hypothetical protein